MTISESNPGSIMFFRSGENSVAEDEDPEQFTRSVNIHAATQDVVLAMLGKGTDDINDKFWLRQDLADNEVLSWQFWLRRRPDCPMQEGTLVLWGSEARLPEGWTFDGKTLHVELEEQSDTMCGCPLL